MELIKHECGIAMVRLLKPLDYYRQKYGTDFYGLNKLYLMMEKQHNRGQEGAGIGCVKKSAPLSAFTSPAINPRRVGTALSTTPSSTGMMAIAKQDNDTRH